MLEAAAPQPRSPAAQLTAPGVLASCLKTALAVITPVTVRGRVREVIGTLVRASCPSARVGELCILRTPDNPVVMQAEVVGFSHGDVLLAPIGELRGISSETTVTLTGHGHRLAVGEWMLGRVLDGFGLPLDGQPVPADSVYCPVDAGAPPPLSRRLIDTALDVGVRALDGLLTCGEGQRLGIFAAAGCGKSTLMGMLTRGADVDVVVIGLIGERGREVREFMERELGAQGMRRAVVVCSTSERPPTERLKAGFVATTIAEYFRDKGQRVLLLMDSLTRLARAQREIGLTAGEPPTRRGFPPSVFSMLPRLLERSGMSARGSITAFYTVLVEGDDMNEPVADETRSILDGHIVLSRKLAAAGHYPAVDILASTSRVMGAITSPAHRELASTFRGMLAKYQEVELLVRVGEYKSGSDAEADKAIACMVRMQRFLRQGVHESCDMSETLHKLQEACR
jgi:type III secretion protein N (ATPase)